MVRGGRLVTGQNPAGATGVAEAMPDASAGGQRVLTDQSLNPVQALPGSW